MLNHRPTAFIPFLASLAKPLTNFRNFALCLYNRVNPATTASIAITHGLKPRVAIFTTVPMVLIPVANIGSIALNLPIPLSNLTPAKAVNIAVPNTLTVVVCLPIKVMTLANPIAKVPSPLAMTCNPR